MFEKPPLLLTRPGCITTLAGAHDAMGARLVQAAGFDGVWASSLEIATARGVPDDDSLDWQEIHAAGKHIADAVEIPVVADCGNGCLEFGEMQQLVDAYDMSRVAALCFEDGASPRRNSLLNGEHSLASVAEFTRRLKAVIARKRRVQILARVQALVAGYGQVEALLRAHAYADAGADAIVIHSRRSSEEEVLSFASKWTHATPLVVIPTTYHVMTRRQMLDSGTIRAAIYANQGIRAAISAMKRVFRQILDDGTSHHAEPWIAPLDEVFALQSPWPHGEPR